MEHPVNHCQHSFQIQKNKKQRGINLIQSISKSTNQEELKIWIRREEAPAEIQCNALKERTPVT